MSTNENHYFTGDPGGPARRRSLTVELAGRRVQVQTAGGVFCPDRLDLGTSVLLREAPDPPASGEFLDLGCGWGPVALTLGLLAPKARVWAVDVNNRALELTAANATALGVYVRTARPDEMPADATFDLLWSNPPIRVGKAVLHHMLLQWLPRLRPAGEAYLVVQRNLGADSLQAWLAGTLPEVMGPVAVERHASAKGFRVLRVTRTTGLDARPA